MTQSAVCTSNACFALSRFTGKERDPETGNDYFGARYYESNLGRFMSPDPISLKELRLFDPQRLNLYAYCHNNPVVCVDTDGRDGWDIVSGIGEGLRNFVVDTYNGVGTAVQHPSTIITGTVQALSTAGHAYFTSAGRSQLASQFSSLSAQEKTAVVTEALTQGVVGAALTKGLGAATKALSGASTTTVTGTTAAGDTFTHYGFVSDADSFANGLRPGSFATTSSGLTGEEAQSGLSLPHATVPDAAYPITPEPGTPIIGPSPAQPAFGQPGGLPEVQFPQGTAPGTVGPPRPIPPKPPEG